VAGRMSGVPWHVGYLARETFENRLEAGYIDEHHKNNKTDEYDFGKHNKFEKRKNNNKKSIASEKNKKTNKKSSTEGQKSKKCKNNKYARDKRGIFAEYGDKVILYCLEDKERIDLNIERSPAELSQVARLCLDKKKNDIFKCNGFTYKIINIQPYR
jgi:hypothetical protein